MKEKNKLILLFKFQNKEIINDLYQNGTIFMNTINFFHNCENEVKRDQNENITHLLQIKKGHKLLINGHVLHPVEGTHFKMYIPDDDKHKFTHIFSMAGLYSNDIYNVNDKVLDKKLFEHGKYILIIHNVKTFIKLFSQAIDAFINREKCYSTFFTNIVEYINPENYDGEMGSFRKLNYYKHEKEWRIGVCCPSKYSKPLILTLGSLKNISTVFKIESIKNIVTQNKDGSLCYNF